MSKTSFFDFARELRNRIYNAIGGCQKTVSIPYQLDAPEEIADGFKLTVQSIPYLEVSLVCRQLKTEYEEECWRHSVATTDYIHDSGSEMCMYDNDLTRAPFLARVMTLHLHQYNDNRSMRVNNRAQRYTLGILLPYLNCLSNVTYDCTLSVEDDEELEQSIAAYKKLPAPSAINLRDGAGNVKVVIGDRRLFLRSSFCVLNDHTKRAIEHYTTQHGAPDEDRMMDILDVIDPRHNNYVVWRATPSEGPYTFRGFSLEVEGIGEYKVFGEEPIPRWWKEVISEPR